jgi:membrane associated rhomboid family serine protease
MLFLWVFGDNVEDAMGHLRFLVFFFLCGLGGSLFHAGMHPDSEQPLIGASGAISGVIASYLMIYPRVRIWGLAFNWFPIHIPALYALGGWILLQAGAALIGADGAIGWWAHLGGLATGAALTPLFVHRNIALFGRRSACG